MVFALLGGGNELNRSRRETTGEVAEGMGKFSANQDAFVVLFFYVGYRCIVDMQG